MALDGCLGYVMMLESLFLCLVGRWLSVGPVVVLPVKIAVYCVTVYWVKTKGLQLVWQAN